MSAKTQKQSGGGQKRVLYFDVLRAIAPIFVVFIHAVVTFRPQNTTNHVIQEFGRWAVPIFFMISGALLINPKKKFDTKTFYLKNIKRLVVCLFAWSAIYALLYTFCNPDRTTSMAYSLSFGIAGGYSYHMWFMYALIAAYIMMPLMRYICADKKMLRYVLFVGLIICLGLPLVGLSGRILAKWTGNQLLMGYAEGGFLVEKVSSRLSSFTMLFYLPLGYYLSTEQFEKKMRWFIYALGIAGFIVELMWIQVGEQLFGVAEATTISFLPVFCVSSAIFLATRNLFQNRKKIPRILSFMAKHSFGVYLGHLVVLSFIMKRSGVFGGSIWMVLLATIATYGLSLIISWLLSKIPFLRRIV